jgi:hypothetical protein
VRQNAIEAFGEDLPRAAGCITEPTTGVDTHTDRLAAPRRSSGRRSYRLCCRRANSPHCGHGTRVRVGSTTRTGLPSLSTTIRTMRHRSATAPNDPASDTHRRGPR